MLLINAREPAWVRPAPGHGRRRRAAGWSSALVVFAVIVGDALPGSATGRSRNEHVEDRAGNFFEDYRVGQVLTPRGAAHGHARASGRSTSRSIPAASRSTSSDEFARACGLPRSPIEDIAAFHVVFGKTVPDVSLNAVANLGYAEARFLRPVWPGDTLTATSEVIGLRETSNRAERGGLGALDRLEPARRGGDALLPLGDGAQARRGGRGAGGGGAGAGAGRGRGGPGGAGGAGLHAATISRWRASLALGRLCGRRADRPCATG